MLKFIPLKNQKKVKSIGVMTSGGDAPGMNAAIRSVTRYALSQGVKVHGIERGYAGLLEGQIRELNASSVANIIQRGGTILKTSRCPDFHKKSARAEAAHILRRLGIDGMVVIGGDGSFKGAHFMGTENKFPIIGVPGTIDNDIPQSEDTIGFDTAVNTAIESIDRIRDTASSHERLFLVEVMGRASGFIAVEVGIGGGAETILVPEDTRSPVTRMCRAIERGVSRGKKSSIIVVAEGDRPGRAYRLADSLSTKGYEPKVCILGHTQRGGAPTAHDRYLASTLSAAAVSALLAGKKDLMTVVQRGEVKLVSLKEAKGKKVLPKSQLELAQNLAI